MKKTLMLTASAAVAAAVLLAGKTPSAELDTSLDVSSEGGPIVVELFTSQGCSSCPPADRLFGRLAGDVIPLAFHVDYWNHLGWQDPFSDARWSARQRRYGQVLNPRGYVYTPQLVVGGQAEAVGSDFREVSSMLREAAARPAGASVELAAQRVGKTLEIAVEAKLGRAASGPGQVLVAVTERGLETKIRSGENAHRTLRYHHVVRELRQVGSIEPGAQATESLSVPIDGAWQVDQLDVVAFVQDASTLAIHGAARWRS